MGIKGNTASIEPCCVTRKEPFTIEGIPIDNVFGIPQDKLLRSGSKINIVHGVSGNLLNRKG